jgi:hypothetical protein
MARLSERFDSRRESETDDSCIARDDGGFVSALALPRYWMSTFMEDFHD